MGSKIDATCACITTPVTKGSVDADALILLLGTPLLTLAGHGCYTPSLCLFIAVAFLQVLLAAESKEQVLSIMEDLSQLKVVPLLQGVLSGQ